MLRALKHFSRYYSNGPRIGNVRASTIPKRKNRPWDDKSIPSLEDFMFQRKVFKLYRAIVRAANRKCGIICEKKRKYSDYVLSIYWHITLEAPDKLMAKELIEYAKGEFLVSKNVSDKHEKRYLLSMGQNQFRDTCKGIGFSFPINIDFNDIKWWFSQNAEINYLVSVHTH
mgnify:CR=1 FL=1